MIPVWIAVLVSAINAAQLAARRRRIAIRRRKAKGESRMAIPASMLSGYMGKKVIVSCAGTTMGTCEGVITKAEDNWIMLEEKRSTKIINCDIVNYISIKKEA